jgi:alpha-L-fucosidase
MKTLIMLNRKTTIKAACLLLTLLSHSFMVKSQQMSDAERKSMEKGKVYPALKGAGQGVSGPGSNLPPEKMQWWEDQKFGMFIHWGLYAIPATGEWTMFNQKIPAEE